MIRCPLYVVAMSLLLHGCGDTGHAYCLCGEPYFKPGVLLTITDDCGTTITGTIVVVGVNLVMLVCMLLLACYWKPNG